MTRHQQDAASTAAACFGLLALAVAALVLCSLGGCDAVPTEWSAERVVAVVVFAVVVLGLAAALMVVKAREGRGGPWDDDDDEAGA